LFNQKYLYFCIFSLALQQVRTAHAGRTHTLCITLSGVHIVLPVINKFKSNDNEMK
jgi:hypothetical protein